MPDWARFSRQSTKFQRTSIPRTSFEKLLSGVLERQQQAEHREAIMNRSLISNVSAQILLHAIGQQVFREPSTCCYFSALGPSHASMASLASSMSTPAATLVQQFDSVVTRRNSIIHPVSLDTLDREVEDMTQLLTSSLRKLCKWECMVVENYRTLCSRRQTSLINLM